MRRIAFLGLGVVAVLALALTAASVDSGLQTVDPEPSGDQYQPQQPSESGSVQTGPNTSIDDGEDSSTAENDTAVTPPTGQRSLSAVLVSIALLVVGGCAVIYGLTRGDDTSTAPESESNQPTTDEPVQRAVTVSDVPPSNELFQNWLALKQATHPSCDAVTPAAVRETAVENGHPRGAVDELTAMFCAVRYGKKELTPSVERRARRLSDQLDTAGEDR